MQFKNILAVAAAGLAATASANLNAREGVDVASYSPSVVYSTRVQTVTQCAANVTDCPEASGAPLTSVIDSTTTICPVTATAFSTGVGNSAPLQTLTVTLTNSSVVTEWTSTIMAPVSTTILSADSPGTLSYVTLSAVSSSSSQPGDTLASPGDTTKTETSSVIKSTSFVYATVTLPANASSMASGPSSFANSTVTITTTSAASSFSTNAIGGLTGAASSTFSYFANGTLATPTTPAAATSESIVPFTGAAAARDLTSSFLAAGALAVLAAF